MALTRWWCLLGLVAVSCRDDCQCSDNTFGGGCGDCECVCSGSASGGCGSGGESMCCVTPLVPSSSVRRFSKDSSVLILILI